MRWFLIYIYIISIVYYIIRNLNVEHLEKEKRVF